MTNIRYTGVATDELAEVLRSGVDHGGNPIEPFVDDVGGSGRPLRCCLTDSQVGDRIALIAWSPFPWQGPYAEVGPIFVHANPCDGAVTEDALPADLDDRAMVLRPYGHDRKIAYHRVQHLPVGGSLMAELAALLAEDDVDFVHGRNVTGGCFSFQASTVADDEL